MTATVDLDRAGTELADRGYCVIPGAITPEELGRLRDALDAVAAVERGEGRAFIEYGGSNQRVWNLINKGQVFLDVIEQPLALELMRLVLGPTFLLSSLTANIAGPGGRRMELHADQGYVPTPWPGPLVANLAWMLDDFTEDNGATIVVPGSHRRDQVPDPYDYTGAVPVVGSAGSVMCFEGRLWHGTGANTSADQRRRAVLAYYCAPFLRQQENVFRSLDPTVAEHLTDQARELLGFRLYKGLGMVNGLPLSAASP